MIRSDDPFTRRIFFQDDFSVNLSIANLAQTSDLETLKRNLKNYGEELHRQMAEILKTETEAIVNLAEHLTNLNSKIDNLSICLSQLQGELQEIFTLIESAEFLYKQKLDEKKLKAVEKKRLLGKLDFIKIILSVNNIIENMQMNYVEDIDNLERSVHKYSFQRTYILLMNSQERDPAMLDTEMKLLKMINEKFLSSLKVKDLDMVSRCLRMYNNLEKCKEAEDFYQVNIVRPALHAIFNEKNSDKFNQDIDEIYQKLLNFLDCDMDILQRILIRYPELKRSFNFILNSFWVEVDKQCRKTLPHITAPGNPELFQKRFVNTWNFLSEISERCGDKDLIRNVPSFQDHIKRFNLAVYFEIRFQQIASQFETDLLLEPLDPAIFIGDNDFGFKIQVTLNLYVALKKCFDKSIFINQLAGHFLKFSMFLLSRYLVWFEKAMDKKTDIEKWTDFIVKALQDIDKVLEIVGAESNKKNIPCIYEIFPEKMKFVIRKVFESNQRVIAKSSARLTDCLVVLKVQECLNHLQNVASIPRLFRRTNRSPPKEPSSYMVEGVNTVLKFHRKYNNTNSSILKLIIDSTITNVTKQFSILVQEVLMSVCKTEESLRRLKSRNVSSTEDQKSSVASETMTDEVKIREQIKQDINYFIKTLGQITTSNFSKDLVTLA